MLGPEPSLAAEVTPAAHHVLLLLSLRALPFVAFACASRRVPIAGKLAWLGVYAAVAWGVYSSGRSSYLVAIAAGAVYYLAFSFLVYRLPDVLVRRSVTPASVFTLCCAGYLLVPALVAPGIAGAAFLIAGWDLAPSAYSYVVDVARSGNRPSLRECLFFLFVNPTLVYSERGAPEAGGAAPGLLRSAAGAISVFVAAAVLRPGRTLLSFEAPFGEAGPWAPYLETLAEGALAFAGVYASHSGLASLQIGLMRHFGYRVPERYRYPFLARSPLDFWRRWNTYLGEWLRRYVFTPVATHVSRRLRRPHRRARHRTAVHGVAMAATFAASAALHDGYFYLSALEPTAHFAQVFFAVLLFTALWSSARRLFEPLAAGPLRGVPKTLAAVVPRACLLIFMAAAAARWG